MWGGVSFNPCVRPKQGVGGRGVGDGSAVEAS